MLLTMYLFAGLLIGFIFGVAVGKANAVIYDEETNERVEHIKQQRIAIEKVKLDIAKSKTRQALFDALDRFNKEHE